MANYYSQDQWGPWSRASIEDMIKTRGGYDNYNMSYNMSDAQVAYWENVIKQMDAMGADYSFQTQGLPAPVSHSGTFGDVVKDFVTSPAFLTAAGGVAGVYAAPAAAAGAGSGSTAGGVTGAAGELAAGGSAAYGGASGAGAAGAGTAGAADASWGVNEIATGGASSSLPPLAETAGSNVTVGTAAGGNAAGPTVIGTATGAGPFVGAGGAMLPAMGEALSGGTTNGTFTPPAQTPPAQPGAYQFPWQNVLGAVLGYLGQQESGKTSEDLMRQMIESDQWRTQQSRYFEPLYEAATKGIGDTAYGQSIAEQAARTSAASGYNMSGNMLTDIAKSLHGGTMDYVRGLTPLATGRGESGAYSAFGPTIAKASEAPYGMIGYGLGEIFRGQQPNNGTQNQTLIDLFR